MQLYKISYQSHLVFSRQLKVSNTYYIIYYILYLFELNILCVLIVTSVSVPEPRSAIWDLQQCNR